MCQASPAAYRERTRGRRLRARGLTSEQIQDRIERRITARSLKDWTESDRLRDELSALGVTVHDSPEGTTWGIAP
jgi:cysteinyl-tRNA synthetase